MTVIHNTTLNSTLATCAETAGSAWRSFMGLMGRPTLDPGGGLVLPRTRGVHTHFMRFPIDVVFYDRDGVVLGIERNLRPWRFSKYHFGACGAVELPAGIASSSCTERGHKLTFSEAAA